MGRPSKTLLELVEDGTFRARRHHELLDSDRLRWKTLSRLQDAYVAAGTEFERRRIAVEFEKAVPKLLQKRARASKSLQEALEELGPPRSAERVKRFFPRFLRWEDGSPFRLDPYQRLIIDLGWQRDEHDRRVFKEIGCGIPRGNGKTPFWSGIGLEATLEEGRPKIFQTSGAGHQAELGLAYAKDWIEESPELRQWLRGSSTKISRRDGRGEYSILKASGSLGHGRKPNIGLVDEKWTIEQPNQEKTVTALETAIFKIPDAFWAWISTAGYSKETLLGEAFEAALKYPHVEHRNEGFHIRAWDEEAGQLFLWWGLPEGYQLDLENDKAMLRIIRLANPASWVDARELLRALKRAMAKSDALVNEWIRFNLNGWTKAKDAWLPAGLWWAMRSSADFPEKVWEADPEIPLDSEIYVAVDAAKKRDTTACVWAYRLPNGRIALRSRVWSAREEVQHDVYVPGGRIRNGLVEDFIVRELAPRYRVAEVVYDPRYFDTQGENLSDAGLTVAEFPQASGLMADAWQHFYEAAIEKRMRHTGDRVLAAHVEAAAAVLQEHGWAVYKLKSSEPIDALVAAAMARERCQRGWEERKARRSVYERRELQVAEVELDEPDVDDELEDEATLIRAARARDRADLAARIVDQLANLAEPVLWEELDELEAAAVDEALARAAARFVSEGQDVRAALCVAERLRRPPTDEDA
jgi:phage terminase large subunit-like protein